VRIIKFSAEVAIIFRKRSINGTVHSEMSGTLSTEMAQFKPKSGTLQTERTMNFLPSGIDLTEKICIYELL